jgi:hypothetical protein
MPPLKINNMKHLLQYLQQNKSLLNIRAIEAASHMPPSTLDKFIKEQRELPVNHVSNLLETLIKIGGGVFKLNHTTFLLASEHQEFEAYNILDISEGIKVNDEKGNTTHYIYPAKLSRDIVTDDVDLLMYL